MEPEPAVTRAFYQGAFLGDAESSREQIAGAIDAFTSRVGARPALIKTFYRLDDDFSAAGWPGQTLRAVSARGATNLVALDLRWQDAPASGLLAAIAGGAADPHITAAARALAALRQPILLELGWEMNGNWDYPWQGSTNGGDAQSTRAFIAAWRRIVDLMRAAGADDIRFVFSPNVGNPVARTGAGPQHWNWYGHYYPGNAWVDIVGLHGFHAPSLWGGTDQAFLQLFDSPAMDAMLSDVEHRFPDKPILIAEFAAEEAAAKPEWIRDAFAELLRRPSVIGAVWFDMNKETDWRIASSPASLAAYRSALVHPRLQPLFRF